MNDKDKIKLFAETAVKLSDEYDGTPCSLNKNNRLVTNWYYGFLTHIGHVLNGTIPCQSPWFPGDEPGRQEAVDEGCRILDTYRRQVNNEIKNILYNRTLVEHTGRS